MRAAIIIPHFNDGDRLAACLRALASQIRDDVEVVVVDNGSDRVPEFVGSLCDGARLVREPVPGAAAARNRGVAETTGSGILFLDCDCIPADDWVARAIALLDGDPGAVFGGRIDVFDETTGPRSGPQAFETVFAFDQRRYVEKQGFSVTANLVTSRAAFRRVGPFRPGVSEDLEWCRRARAAGLTLRYCDDLVVSHPTRRDWPSLRRKWRRLTDEMFALGRHTIRGRLAWAVRGLMMPVSVLAHAPRVLRCAKLSPSEKLRALATLARLRFLRMGWMLAQAVSGGSRDAQRG